MVGQDFVHQGDVKTNGPLGRGAVALEGTRMQRRVCVGNVCIVDQRHLDALRTEEEVALCPVLAEHGNPVQEFIRFGREFDAAHGPRFLCEARASKAIDRGRGLINCKAALVFFSCRQQEMASSYEEISPIQVTLSEHDAEEENMDPVARNLFGSTPGDTEWMQDPAKDMPSIRPRPLNYNPVTARARLRETGYRYTPPSLHTDAME